MMLVKRPIYSLAALICFLMLAACGQGEEPLMESVPVQPISEVVQAPLEQALRPRQHGDLVGFFHHPGAVYTIHVTPLRVTTILFQDDERVVTIGAGDTERFNVDLTESAGRHALLVKPVDSDIQTNISVVTDQRVYVLNLMASQNTNYVVAFERYDEGKLEQLPAYAFWPPRPLARPDRAVGQSTPVERAS